MNLYEVLDMLGEVIGDIRTNEYDGVIVKKLESSNTLDIGRSTKQTHIAISGAQMDIFPSVISNGYNECRYEDRDDTLKKYFLVRVPVILYKKNIESLDINFNADISFGSSNFLKVQMSVVRSRRSSQADQIQLSLITYDDEDFIRFRKMINTGDYIVFLKHKQKFMYDCFGFKENENIDFVSKLSSMNNKFYKEETTTVVSIDDLLGITPNDADSKEYSLEDLGKILKEMYTNAEDKKKMTSIHVFGIKYGKAILDNQIPLYDIVSEAGLNKSFSTEISKGINIYKFYTNVKVHKSDDIDGTKFDPDLIDSRDVKAGADNILFYGVPGSGKSFALKEFYKDERYIERILFHPDYTYSDFIGHIIPKIEKVDNERKLTYKFLEGPFTRVLKKAVNDPYSYYYLIIEELNRGNAPAIFGDIFQLLDRKYDRRFFDENELGESEYGISNTDVATKVYNDENQMIRIPPNMYILSTMNTADQNVFTLDTAFQRRWKMKQVDNNFSNGYHSKKLIHGTRISWEVFATVVNDLIVEFNSEMTSAEDKRLGVYFASEQDLDSSIFAEKILKYLWDDAFKIDRNILFNSKFKTLDTLIYIYKNTDEDKLKAVLNEEVYNNLHEKMK